MASGGLVSCDWSDRPTPSVLVIAVDSLSADSVTCSDDLEVARNSGLAQLCNESVRFTHAYSTSTLGGPALSSILTGRLPVETGVRNNGSNFLSAKFNTVAEAAIRAGYRTAFFSGGPAALRRLGFSQGFEVFDDNIPIASAKPYRTASETLELAFKWLDSEIGSHPFLSMVYLADLDFSSRPTTTDMGEQRSSTSRSQLQEVDESLSGFISQFKKSKRWDDTFVFLVGLNGLSPDERVDELPGTNLFLENTQVTLLLKPATKKRDLGKKWKVDSNISLIDLGATLFDIFGESLEKSEMVPAYSLRSSWETGALDLDANRRLLMESSWGAWLGITSVRYAIVKGHLFALFDQVPRVYNALIDRLQMSPLSLNDVMAQEILAVPESLKNLSLGSGNLVLSRETFELYRMARRYWGTLDQNLVNSELKEFIEIHENNSTAVGWAALRALQTEDWDELLSLARRTQRLDWAYVALKNKNETSEAPKSPCWDLYFGVSSDWEACRDEEALSLLLFLKEKAEGPAFTNFLRRERQRIWGRRLEQYNWAAGYLWDVESRPIEPQFVDLILALNENKKWALWTRARLQQRFEEN